jgi:large subunit ribosomal protein L23
MLFKPVTSEKAVRMIEAENTIIFGVDRRLDKEEIKKGVEEMFKVKIEKINVMNRKNTKFAFITLKKEFKAIDIATKLGMI